MEHFSNPNNININILTLRERARNGDLGVLGEMGVGLNKFLTDLRDLLRRMYFLFDDECLTPRKHYSEKMCRLIKCSLSTLGRRIHGTRNNQRSFWIYCFLTARGKHGQRNRAISESSTFVTD